MDAPHAKERDAVVHSRAAVISDSVAADSRSVDVVASTEALDSHGTVLRQNWRLDRYASNPIVLYAHDCDDLPIGLASNVRVDGGQLRATLTFSSADLNPMAEQVWRNVQAKVLRGISVGFWPHSCSWEKKDDVEYLVLDDLELLEISVVPVASNPETLAEMRARAIASQQPIPSPAAPVESTTRAAGEDTQMAENKPESNQFVQAITIALGLPVGSTESDILARAGRLIEFERDAVSSAGATAAPEAVGVIRGLKTTADRATKLEAELTLVRGERDKQNFDTLIVSGKSDRKLDAALAKFYEDEFNQSAPEARAAVVERLRGHLSVLKPSFPARAMQVPTVRADAEQTWNGKTYAQLGPQERANLKQADPELAAVMRRDWEAAGKPATPIA